MLFTRQLLSIRKDSAQLPPDSRVSRCAATGSKNATFGAGLPWDDVGVDVGAGSKTLVETISY